MLRRQRFLDLPGFLLFLPRFQSSAFDRSATYPFKHLHLGDLAVVTFLCR